MISDELITFVYKVLFTSWWHERPKFDESTV